MKIDKCLPTFHSMKYHSTYRYTNSHESIPSSTIGSWSSSIFLPPSDFMKLLLPTPVFPITIKVARDDTSSKCPLEVDGGE